MRKKTVPFTIPLRNSKGWCRTRRTTPTGEKSTKCLRTWSQLEASIADDPDDIHEDLDWSKAIIGIPPPKDHINIRTTNTTSCSGSSLKARATRR